MIYKINFEAYAANFSLPISIIDDDLSSVNADYLKVILLIFRNSNKNYSSNLLSNLLNISEKIVDEAISYWINKGLLLKQENNEIPHNVISISGRVPKKVTSQKHVVNSELSYLLECMENQLKRPITSVEYKSVIHIMEYIKLPADVILMAVEYCICIDKVNVRYIEKVCASWMENGITTHELAEQYLNFLKQSRQNEDQVKKLFGIQDRNLIDSERKTINRWFYEYKFDIEMIKLAYEKMITAIAKLSFPYIDKIISSWNEKGYTDVNDVIEHEGIGRKKQHLSSSYDIEELDRYWDNVPKLN